MQAIHACAASILHPLRITRLCISAIREYMQEMISLIASVVGPRFAKPVFWGVLALMLIGIGFGLSKCGHDRTTEAQAEQSSASAEAYSNAVAKGVEIIDNRAITESALAEATAEVKTEIGGAASLNDIRSSLVTKLCAQASHMKDPACVR